MRDKKEIKKDLLAALDVAGDEALGGVGFKRKKGAFDYFRDIRDARQVIDFAVDFSPKYQPDEELHIHPAVRIAMKSVSDVALQLVAGNRILLANAPDVIINQPIEFMAPKSERTRWFASGFDEMRECLDEICCFLKKWVIPVVDGITVPNELISVYERSDDRIMKQRHWYIFVAAAYLNQCNKHEALSVLHKNLGAPGSRSRYSAAFEVLGSG